MRQMWRQDNTSQVEIIELNSDDSGSSINSDEDAKFGHIWSYINNNHIPNESRRVDENHDRARVRNNAQNGNGDHSQTTLFPEDIDNAISDVVTDFVYSSLYSCNNYSMKNYQSNCFNILKNPFNSDSSSDDVEVIDTSDYWENNDVVHQSGISLDDGIDNEKSTIWIYSIKNKHRLSEDDFKLVNVPSQEWSSSTTNSFENYSEDINNTVKESSRRVGSPIPATYVPRLNLVSPRLPTLTEVTEPTNSKEIRKFKENQNDHKVNGWCDETNAKKRFENQTKIINWMCLSPREKRRFKRMNTSPIPSVKTSNLESEPKFDDSFRKTPSFIKIETKADVNVTPNDNIQDKPSHSSSNRSFDSKVEINKDLPLLLTCDIENENNYQSEDYGTTTLRKPKIIIQNENVKKIKETSNPIQRLDSNNWIHGDYKECVEKHEQTNNESKRQCLIQTEKNINSPSSSQDCAGNRLWARNRSLLKPAEWTEYKVITDRGSIPSLQLSMDTNEDHTFWLYRLAACFKCCK